jgi:Ca2+-binding EF-hand superfamily protein
MKYRNTLIAAAVAAVVPLAGTALADDSHKTGKAGASFDALDTNRDGRISRAEASADSKIVFARADANGDGYLDNMEYAKAKKAGDTTTSPEPQSQSSYPNDASGQQTEPVSPQGEQTTPPSDTETPRQ